jgi:ribosomal protein S4E
MDIISIPKTSENYRLLYDTRSTYRVTTLLGTRHEHPSKAVTRTQEMPSYTLLGHEGKEPEIRDINVVDVTPT